MKHLFCSLALLLYFYIPGFAQENPDDSRETLLEQSIALIAEQSAQEILPPQVIAVSQQVDNPLFIGVDDITVPAYEGNPATNQWFQAFIGFQV